MPDLADTSRNALPGEHLRSYLPRGWLRKPSNTIGLAEFRSTQVVVAFILGQHLCERGQYRGEYYRKRREGCLMPGVPVRWTYVGRYTCMSCRGLLHHRQMRGDRKMSISCQTPRLWSDQQCNMSLADDANTEPWDAHTNPAHHTRRPATDRLHRY
ncbi:hypothetical protein OBBRIDRAFT_296911 [Obba rivulosa]|uniref:Uncharacterized protein n=1 Tax=Obba rivulosa TaxID=1052685 RepID=A0A8E2AJD0_9APHY|nr:hypothetical protein OBBRIDRAFT_296911 [Obba rivulosa]